MDKDALDLDRLESLARAATTGPWRWEDPDTDLPCLPDAPCSAGDHDAHAYSFSLRTAAEFPSNVGSLPRFIISRADEFHEVENDGTWTHPDAEFIAALSPEVVLSLIAAVRAALGANGCVVVPRHLLDELLAAGRDAINALDYFTGSGSAKVLSRRRLVAARAAVVEAVGPTREDGK